MLVIICPNCGPRNSDEFTYQGERRPRPDTSTTDPGAWRRYLYLKTNQTGWVTERWFHGSGCRRFLMVERHMETNEIRSVSEPGQK
jgi:heterotetrameric sarcosine oxidase delta subunit